MNSKSDKTKSPKKVSKKNSPESKPQITTSKQFFKSLKQKSKLNDSKSKNSKVSDSSKIQTPQKSPNFPKVKKEKSRKNNNEQKEFKNSNLGRKMKPPPKPELKRKIVKLNVGGNSKINVTKLEELLQLKASNPFVYKSQSLRERMVSQLRASRFRYLNEELYKNDSTVSKQMFKEDPEAFKAYHHGYQQQVSQWPLNPLSVIIASIKKM